MLFSPLNHHKPRARAAAAGICALSLSLVLAACGGEVENDAIDQILESALETTTPEAMSTVVTSLTSASPNPSASLASSTVTAEPTPAFFDDANLIHSIRDRLELTCDTEIADGDLAGNLHSLACTDLESGVLTEIAVIHEDTDLETLRGAFAAQSLVDGDNEPFEIVDPRGEWVVFTHGSERAHEYATTLDSTAEPVVIEEETSEEPTSFTSTTTAAG